MSELAERAYFLLCLTFGRLLRAGRYSNTRIVERDGELEVRKTRSFYAPLLIWIGDPLVRILDTRMRVLSQREWEERERLIYRDILGRSIGIDRNGTLVLPFLNGETLATLLEDSASDASRRTKAIELAVVALARFHDQGFTHGDAMAENVMVDLDAGVAQWFDFETVHDAKHSMTWRRADDLRALIMTCLVRADRSKRREILRLILDVYGDDEITRELVTIFASVFQRPLTFHLGQAALSFRDYREISRWLREKR